MSKQIFFNVLFIIMIGWIAAGVYDSSQHLEQPIFLDHYIDEYAQDQLHMQFYYITNNGDKNTVNYITLGDIPGYIDVYYDPVMEDPPYVQRYGHYELRMVNVTLDLYEINHLKEKMIVNEMTVHLSDGQSILVDIGEVTLHPENQISDASLLSQKSSSTSAGWSASLLQAKEDISISELKPHIPSADTSSLKILLPHSMGIDGEVNYVEDLEAQLKDGKGEDYRQLKYPVKLEKGENLAFSIRNQEEVKYILNSWMMIESKDKNGSEKIFPTDLYHIPDLTTENIKAIIERKGAGE